MARRLPRLPPSLGSAVPCRQVAENLLSHRDVSDPPRPPVLRTRVERSSAPRGEDWCIDHRLSPNSGAGVRSNVPDSVSGMLVRLPDLTVIHALSARQLAFRHVGGPGCGSRILPHDVRSGEVSRSHGIRGPAQ